MILLILLMQPLSILELGEKIVMLFPKGMIALEQRNLLLIIQALMLLVIIPVYILTFLFSWKYSAHNPKGEYDPDLVDSHLAEVIWWGVPLVMTLIVAGITWVKTYELDPFKPLESDVKKKTIQVVALQWKWLFIYPEEKVASLNFLQIPEKVPIQFEITADAPMNSFWIPSLGGQIYAMPKMKTELNLIANEVGDFRGSSANISGEGFAEMKFVTRASTEKEYQEWIKKGQAAEKTMNWEEYEKIALPGVPSSPELYRLTDDGLFHQILMKYMHPKENE